MNVEGLLCAVLIHVPLVEPERRNNAALPVFPGSAKARTAFEGFSARIESVVLAGLAVRKERHQSPAQQHAMTAAVAASNGRNRLRRGGVEIGRELPFAVDEIELALDGRLIGADVTAAHLAIIPRLVQAAAARLKIRSSRPIS